MVNSKVFNNAKWIIICKIIQSILQLIIGMISARYLGPSNYGLINYAASVVAFAVPIMHLGLNSTLVQEFIQTPEDEGKIIGTSFVMTLISSFACVIGVGVFVSVANAGETDTLFVCVLYSISLFFRALELIQYWFQYKLLSKYSSLCMLAAYVAVSAYKIFLLVTQKSVYWFVLTNSIEFGIIAIALIFIYLKMGNGKLQFSFKLAKRLFSRSKYYIISSLMVTTFANVAGVILKAFVGEAENGYFAAAITCSNVVNFINTAILDSMRPDILSKKNGDKEAYEKSISGLFCLITYFTLLQSICFAVFAPIIVKLLYGNEYLPAIPVLQILTWYTPFSYMGAIRDIWILAEGKQKYLWVINLCGASASILFNIIFISMWGACGAALASFLTQIFTNVILGFIMKPIRKNNVLLLKGLSPKFFVNECKGLINSIRQKSFKI